MAHIPHQFVCASDSISRLILPFCMCAIYILVVVVIIIIIPLFKNGIIYLKYHIYLASTCFKIIKTIIKNYCTSLLVAGRIGKLQNAFITKNSTTSNLLVSTCDWSIAVNCRLPVYTISAVVTFEEVPGRSFIATRQKRFEALTEVPGRHIVSCWKSPWRRPSVSYCYYTNVHYLYRFYQSLQLCYP